MAICVGGSAALGSGSFADLASALGCGQRYLRLAAGGGGDYGTSLLPAIPRCGSGYK